MVGTAPVVYRPFPPFAQWQSVRFDTGVLERFTADLALVRAKTDAAQWAATVRRASRMAAVDTGAIEGLYDVDRGFTFSVAAGVANWKAIHRVKGADVQRAIYDALAGYDLVLDVATQALPISEAWLRELHAVLCASQDTYRVLTAAGRQDQRLPKGEYKTQPNNPFNVDAMAVHAYASVSDTPAEMHRLVQEFDTAAFRTAPSVVQAAFAHYAFVVVHPFVDGNGRVARALASVFLYRDPGIPLVVFADQRDSYLTALEAADAGRPEGFVRFCAERVIDTIQLLKTDLQGSASPGLADRIAEAEAVLARRTEPLPGEMDELALRLLEELRHAVDTAAQGFVHKDWLSMSTKEEGFTPPDSVPGYRPLDGAGRFLIVRVGLHMGVVASRRMNAQCATEAGRPDVIVVDDDGQVVLDAFVRDLKPGLSSTVRYRTASVAESLLADLVAQVTPPTSGSG